MIKIKDVELEFDLLDVETAEKYDKAMKKLEGLKESVKGMSAGKSIRQQCTCVCEVIDELFGEGTAEEIFAGKLHLGDCLDAIEVIVLEATKQSEEMNKKYSKYTPNRAQRRK